MATPDTSRFSWPGIDPAEWIRTWQAAWRGGPGNLVQPILPGWTLNINSINSTAPQTEVDVVSKHSYGRQLGRLSRRGGAFGSPLSMFQLCDLRLSLAFRPAVGCDLCLALALRLAQGSDLRLAMALGRLLL